MILENRTIKLLEKSNNLISSYYFENAEPYSLYSGDSLISGNGGLVLYHFYYGRILGKNQSTLLANNLLENIFNRVLAYESSLNNYSFSYGLSGFKFLLDHLVQNDFIDYEDENAEEIDQDIFDWINEKIDKEDREYLHGAMGALHYIISKKDPLKYWRQIDNTISKLIDVASMSDSKAYIEVFSEIAPEYPKGSINLSLSHGLTGILLVLLQLNAVGYKNDNLTALIVRCFNYLKEKMYDVNFSERKFCHFTAVETPDRLGKRRNSRLAWCYGDLNVAIAFFKGWKILGTQEYYDIAERIALTTLKRRELENTYIADSTFCHGASGVAMCYKTIYDFTGNENFLDGANYWTSRAIDFLDNELSNNFYQSRKIGKLIDGLPGTVLSILTLSSQKSGWEKVFLL